MLRSGHNTLLLVLLLATKIFVCSKISKNTRIAYNIFPFLLHIYCITQIIFRSTHIFQVYKIFINVLHQFIFRRIFCYTSYKMLQISAHFLDFHSNDCSEFCPFNGPPPAALFFLNGFASFHEYTLFPKNSLDAQVLLWRSH